MVKDISALENNLLKIDEIKAWSMDFMQYMFTRSQENIIESGSSDTGGLLISGIPPHIEGDEIKFSYDAPHAVPIEYGTDPHMPPVAPIIRWVQRKLGVFNKKKASRIAWAIAMNIKKNGTDAKPFLRPAKNDTVVAYGLTQKSNNVG